MAVKNTQMPENPEEAELNQITNEFSWQNYLENYFQSHDWNVAREVKPAGKEFRADLLVEHERLGWFGIETKFANLGGKVIAEAHHQIVKKYRNRRYFGKKIELWVYAPFYRFYCKDADTTLVNTRFFQEWQQGFLQRHGIGFLTRGTAKGAGKWEMQFELSSPNHFVGIEKDSKRKPNIEAIKQTVRSRCEQYDYN
jgi:hypothetical protein